MDIVLTPKQIVYAHNEELYFKYTVDKDKQSIPVWGYIFQSERNKCDALQEGESLNFTIRVKQEIYDLLPEEMRALSSPEPKAPSLDYSRLVAFDKHDQEHYFGNEPDDTTLILNHVTVDGNGKGVSQGVEIQRDSLKTAQKQGFKILIEKEMKHVRRPEPDQRPTNNGEPDYKALALLLIDLYEEKREIDSKIAAIKSQLQ